VKGATNARNLKSNLQFHSLQLNGELESYIYFKKSYAGADDSFVAAGISVHTSGLSGFSWLSLQRRMRPRTGKGPVQITMMETESENFI
jgi:hypothetical protein